MVNRLWAALTRVMLFEKPRKLILLNVVRLPHNMAAQALRSGGVYRSGCV